VGEVSVVVAEVVTEGSVEAVVAGVTGVAVDGALVVAAADFEEIDDVLRLIGLSGLCPCLVHADMNCVSLIVLAVEI